MIDPQLTPGRHPLRTRIALRWGGAVLASCMTVGAAAQNEAGSPAPPVAFDDFRIQRDGTIARPTPAPPTPTPAPAPPVTVAPAPVSPAPVVIAPAPIVTPVPAPVAVPGPRARPPVAATRTTPRPPAPTRTAPPAAAAAAAAAPESTPPPPAVQPEPTVVAPAPQPEPIIQPSGPPPAPAIVDGPTTVAGEARPAATAPADGFGNLAWLGLGLAGAIAGALAWRARRPRSTPSDAAPLDVDARVDEEVFEPEGPLAAAAEVAQPGVVAVPASRAAIPKRSTASVVARPRLDLQFKPSTASATDARATVEYLLNIVNAGDVPARRVRMEARLFAMGPDHDAALAAFFEGPLGRPLSLASTIPAGIGFDQRSQVAMPRDAVQPIHVADRQLFVPLVAFKLTYEWSEGEVVHKEEVTASYVVGREAKPPAAKMAPFRLDQGPRVYREVGQRRHQMRKTA